MLERLTESAPPKRRMGGRITSSAFSFAVHTGLIFAAVIGTMKENVATTHATVDAQMTFVVSPPEDETPRPDRLDRPPPRTPRTITAPIEVPTGIPPVDLSETFDPAFDVSLFTTVESVFTGLEAGLKADPARVHSIETIDEPPERISSPPLEYPRMMQQAGIEGLVTVQAIVDTTGRAERESITVVTSTNSTFEGAAKRLIARSLFRPGRVAGTPVRVMIQITVHFTLLDIRP